MSEISRIKTAEAKALSIDEFKEIFNHLLVKYIDHYIGELRDPIMDLIEAGGKRLRPYLIYLCSSDRGFNIDEDTLLTGLVPELIHTASLVHDDIIDNAKVRRGRPTIHSKWNTRIAVLSGDLIFCLVLKIIGKIKTKIPSLIEEVVATIEDMIEGQAIEDKSRHSGLMPELTILKSINELKTGSLFSLSFYLGTALRIDKKDLLDKSKEAGRLFGLIFQIYDDVIDIFGKKKIIKKDRLKDIKEGNITIPYVIACHKNKGFYDLLRNYKDTPDPDLLHKIRETILKDSRDRILSETGQSVLEFKSIVKEIYVYPCNTLTDLIDNLYEKIENILS